MSQTADSVMIKVMKQTDKCRQTLTMQGIFRAMMEEGYYPKFQNTYILFSMDDNTAVVEYEEGILSVRLFFTIEKEAYTMFLEASNNAMSFTYMVKPVIMSDKETIMFSCETICHNLREFKKMFPHCLDLLEESITVHKKEMKACIEKNRELNTRIPASDEWSSLAGTPKHQKILS